MGVLVLSNHGDETADYLCARMAAEGVAHARLDTERFASSSSLVATPKGLQIRFHGTVLAAEDVSVVWYRRPKPIADAAGKDPHDRAFTAAEWTAALEGFLAHVPSTRWINHPASIMGASSKLEQLTRAALHGLAVPDWLCTTFTDDAIGFCESHNCTVVAKPLYCGYVEREWPNKDTIIYTSRVSLADLRSRPAGLGAPTLFQRELVNGHDVRVTIVDNEVVAVRLFRTDGAVDVRRDNMVGVRYEVVKHLPSDVQGSLLSLVRSYQLRFAAVDLMVTGDGWHFLEINANGQWAWLDLCAEANIYRSFLNVFRGKS